MYRKLHILRTLLFASVCLPFALQGQLLPPFQPEQDCINALTVCQSVFVQPGSYQGEGLNPNEINNANSCLGSGEENDVWYIFTVQTAGLLDIRITPFNIFDDYDWAVYNLTNHNCADIFGTPAIEVSCNYSGTPGLTGAFQLGAPNSQGGGGAPFNAPINVNVGETYVLNVSNFTGSGTGYTLDFSNSTAVIFDNVPPLMDSIAVDCGASVSVRFSENVVCPTVDATDFVVTGPAGNHVVTATAGINCAAGGSFEDEFTLTLTPPITVPGMYYISVVDTILDNCDNVAIYNTDSILVSFPNINATASADSVCAGDSVLLSTPATIGYTYAWSNGTPSASTYVNPLATTTYTVSATDAIGCVYSGSVTVNVIPTPTGNFSFANPSVCADDTISVLYTGSSLPVANFNWNFGGGNVISGAGSGPYVLSWPIAGTQTVSLDVDQYGCPSVPFTQSVTVHQIPTSSFNMPAQTCSNAPTSISYIGNASPTATYTWDFDGGIVLAGAGAGPYLVEWAIPGPKNIGLIVTENTCISDYTEQQIMVNALPVNSIAALSDQCFDGNNFSFSYDGPASPAQYSWDFGDGSLINPTANPSHSYNVFGPQTVTLLITDGNGCQSTATQSFVIHPPVNADFNYNQVCEGQNTPFTDLSSIHNSGAITGWSWAFGDGAVNNTASPSHQYPQQGTYTVKLVATSDQGCLDSMTKLIEVYDQPIADFSFEDKCQGYEVPFVNLSQFDDPSLTYTWLFGDGNNTNQINPKHLYNGYGDFNVSMTLTNTDGCSDTHTELVQVHPLPVPQPTFDETCQYAFTELTDNSYVPGGGSIVQYYWKTTENRGYAGKGPQPRFSVAGVYPINMILTSDQGCVDSLVSDLTVFPIPRVSFVAIDACLGDEVKLGSTSTIVDSLTQDYIADWQWDFGDGQSSSGLSATTHTYAQAGTYEVSLTTISDKGCVSQKTEEVITHPPAAVPELQPDTVCFGESAILWALPSSDGATIEWFDSPSGGLAFHTESAYLIPTVPFGQTYYVEAISPFGCVSPRVPISTKLYSPGLSKIAASSTVVEIPNSSIQFDVEGTLEVVSAEWMFGDGSSSVELKPVYTYELPGRYEVSAKVITVEGCERILTETIEVKAPIAIYIPSAFTPNGDGRNDEFFLGSHLFQQVQFEVYNRWGTLVYQAEQPDFRWNGQDTKGQMIPEGVYVYKLQGQDILGKLHTRSGTITVVK
ncbi:MAG: PKD domain-containing protein [Bacteroidota bacterium]